MSVLLAPLMANTSESQLARDDFHMAQLQNLILDFVTFCVEHHTYHMKNFLNKKDLLRRVLVLLKSKHQFLQLTALRFLRKIIALKDEQYNLTIARNNLFQPVVETFKINKRRYNLLNSALIELFEYIRQEDMKTLINYFVENFYNEFENVNYVKTFQELKARYENHQGRKNRGVSDSSSRSNENFSSSQSLPIHSSHHLLSQRLQKDERDLDADEESWFNDETDENKVSTNNNGNSSNAASDDEESQTELTSNQTDPSAISTTEPVRSYHFLLDNDDDALPISSTDHLSRSTSKKPVISFHIRRSPLSSIGQSSSSSSNSTENDVKVDSPSSSPVPRPMTPTETNSTFAMSPGLSSIADQYNDDDDENNNNNNNDEERTNQLNSEDEQTSVSSVSTNSAQTIEHTNNSDSQTSTRKRKIGEQSNDDSPSSSPTSSSFPNDDASEQTKLFKRSNDQSTM